MHHSWMKIDELAWRDLAVDYTAGDELPNDEQGKWLGGQALITGDCTSR